MAATDSATCITGRGGREDCVTQAAAGSRRVSKLKTAPVHVRFTRANLRNWFSVPRPNISLQSGTRHTKFLLPKPMRKPMVKSALQSAFTPRPRYGAVPSWAAAVAIAALPLRVHAVEARHCLNGEEQRTALASGRTVPLATVIHALHRLPKDVIKAQLCQEPERLVYVLTLLARDGKVKREIVDATNGAVVGER